MYFVLKNTGHDHLGRSSGDEPFAIWTHNLKGGDWLELFVPKDASEGMEGVPAVTLPAGEQWLDVYRDVAKRNATVVGGSAQTGRSSWSTQYNTHKPTIADIGQGPGRLDCWRTLTFLALLWTCG